MKEYNDNFKDFRSFISSNCSSKSGFGIIEGTDGCSKMQTCLTDLQKHFPNTIKNDVQGAQAFVRMIMTVASEQKPNEKSMLCVIREPKPSDCKQIDLKKQFFGLQRAYGETLWKDCGGVLEGKNNVFLNL